MCSRGLCFQNVFDILSISYPTDCPECDLLFQSSHSVFPPFLFSISKPITDGSPMRRSASSLASQRGGTELNLREYTLERPLAAQNQEKERDRAHQHHHHHRCHRRRDKKHKSLDRAISEEQPGSMGMKRHTSESSLERHNLVWICHGSLR